MTEPIIREFTLELYDAVLALWQECEGVGLSDADSKENIERYLDRNPGMSFVAVNSDEVVAAILVGHDGRRGYIHHLAVAADYRRRGIGQALMEHGLEALKRAGIQKCHLYIFDENASGIAFWNSQGWTLRSDISVMSVPV